MIEHPLITTLELASMDYFCHKPVSPEETSPPSIDLPLLPPSTSSLPSSAVGAHISHEFQPDVDKVEESRGPASCRNKDVEKDAQQIEHDVEQFSNLGESLQKDIETLKHDTNLHHSAFSPSSLSDRLEPQKEDKRLPTLSIDLPSSPPSIPNPKFIIRPPTPFHRPTHRRSFSSPPISSSLTSSSSTQEDLIALRAALLVVKSHISKLDEGIKANIAEQVKHLEIPDRVVMDADSLPNFKVEKNDAEVSRALLMTVKVCCVVERGMEALVEVLEKGELLGEGRRKAEVEEEERWDGRGGYEWDRRKRE
ncbi:uncharacterized protein PAC_07581 [Phialocephala subalpina]|uniref:Uncharacterized protein n=1 Tax=Phialocephala subalpina TaxID=576137 RepID=A0A1L7WY42_9HELO|nr:uncharacterized protein PAC_07581 [Phialocephala subalpina]